MKEFLKMQIIQALLPMVIKIVTDMITPEGVVKYRDKLLAMLESIVGKTVTEFDDKLLEVVIQAVFLSGAYRGYALQIIGWVIVYVEDSATTWDDIILLPPLKALKACFLAEESTTLQLAA